MKMTLLQQDKERQGRASKKTLAILCHYFRDLVVLYENHYPITNIEALLRSEKGFSFFAVLRAWLKISGGSRKATNSAFSPFQRSGAQGQNFQLFT
jgi:hypothetical protein